MISIATMILTTKTRLKMLPMISIATMISIVYKIKTLSHKRELVRKQNFALLLLYWPLTLARSPPSPLAYCKRFSLDYFPLSLVTALYVGGKVM